MLTATTTLTVPLRLPPVMYQVIFHIFWVIRLSFGRRDEYLLKARGECLGEKMEIDSKMYVAIY